MIDGYSMTVITKTQPLLQLIQLRLCLRPTIDDHVSTLSRVYWSVNKNQKSRWQDSNLRPSAPKADALPDCATPRYSTAPKVGFEPTTK